MTDKPRVVLIDLSSLFWTAWMVNHENGIQQARTITLANVNRCIGEGDPLVAICCDSGRSFRKDLSPEYKANRDKQPEAAYGELQRTKERLAADGYLLWEAANFEADDVLATACDKASTAGHEVRVCSADKDLLQLCGPGRDVLRTHTWEVWSAATVEEKIKVKPTQIVDFLALQGDSSDNIPGAPGIGKVRAAELLAKYGTVGKLYAALDRGETVATPANQRALTENRKAVELSLELVTLRYDAPIDFHLIYDERKVTPLTQNSESPPAEENEPTTDAPLVADSAGDSSGSTEPSTKVDIGQPATSALVPVVEYTRQLEPRSMSHAVWLGRHLYDSRLYTKFPTAEAITAVILRGREMGLGAATALDNFHVIEGKPCPYAYLIIARAKEHPDCDYLYCAEASATSARWVTKNRRNPVETSVTYTFDQAKAAGLVKPNSAWFKHPEDQVVKTAGVKLARREYPSAALGLYAVIEMGGDE